MQKLKPQDLRHGLNFCEWELAKMDEDPQFFLRKFVFSDEVHVSFDGYMNKQSRHIWCEQHLEELPELSIYPKKQHNTFSQTTKAEVILWMVSTTVQICFRQISRDSPGWHVVTIRRCHIPRSTLINCPIERRVRSPCADQLAARIVRFTSLDYFCGLCLGSCLWRQS